MASHEQEIQDLLKEFRAGSQEAARKFFNKYGQYILKVIRLRLDRKLRPRFDSTDFSQDAWASFVRQPPPPEAFASLEALLAYLAQLARNKVIGAIRHYTERERQAGYQETSLDGPAQSEAEEVVGPGPTPSQVAMAEEKWQEILQNRPPQQQQILTLLREGHTHDEIAQLLGLPSKRVQRFVRKLKVRFVS